MPNGASLGNGSKSQLDMTNTNQYCGGTRENSQKLSQRWDSVNNGLGELETTMIPWRQLLRELGTIVSSSGRVNCMK